MPPKNDKITIREPDGQFREVRPSALDPRQLHHLSRQLRANAARLSSMIVKDPNSRGLKSALDVVKLNYQVVDAEMKSREIGQGLGAAFIEVCRRRLTPTAFSEYMSEAMELAS